MKRIVVLLLALTLPVGAIAGDCRPGTFDFHAKLFCDEFGHWITAPTDPAAKPNVPQPAATPNNDFECFDKYTPDQTDLYNQLSPDEQKMVVRKHKLPAMMITFSADPEMELAAQCQRQAMILDQLSRLPKETWDARLRRVSR